jgi:hypothetical protein
LLAIAFALLVTGLTWVVGQVILVQERAVVFLGQRVEPGLIVVCGVLEEAVFQAAQSVDDVCQRSKLVCGADLIDDCLGAVLAAVMWVLLRGLPATCWQGSSKWSISARSLFTGARSFELSSL